MQEFHSAMNADQHAKRKHGLRRALLLGCTAAAFMSAGAQAKEETAQVAGADANDGAQIIVTATKRSEALQDVPQAITAFSEKALTNLNVQSFDDYANKVPNLSFNAGSQGRASFAAGRSVTIRGIVGNNTTALYVDDTPIPVSQDPRIVDVERIEVLKGPQGTLYGSAAIGGTMRIITKAPSFTNEETRYMVQAGATKHGGSANFGGNASANFVLVPDKVAVRIIGYVNHDAGFVTRTFPLANAGGTTSPQRGSQNDVGAGLQYGGSVTLKALLSDSLTANVKVLAQWDDYDKGPALVYRGNPGFDPVSLTVDRAYDVPEYSHNRWYLPSLTLNWTSGWLDVTSSTSYFNRKSDDSADVSEAMHQFVGGLIGFNSFGGIRGGGKMTDRQFQQELRIAGKPTDNLNFLVGGYYLHGTNINNGATRVIPGFSASPIGQAIGATQDTYFTVTSTDRQSQKALFGEVSYKFFDMATVTAGVRRFWIDQSTDTYLFGFIVGLNSPITIPSAFKNEGWSPKFSIKLEPGKNTTVYASASKGFRPGGAGLPAPTQCLSDLAALGLTASQFEAGYKPDSVWTYEVGFKQGLPRRGLFTASVFQTDWGKIQQTVTLRCGTSFVGNAGAARIRGAEAEFNGNLTDELSLRAGIGYTDAKITDDAGGTTNQSVGSRLYNVPKWTASASAYYIRPISKTTEGFFSADWQYTGSSLSTNNSTSAPAERGAYSLVNLRIGAHRGSNELSLFVNNVFNKLANYGDYIPDIGESFTLTTGASVPHARVFVATPRTIGVQFRHGF